MLAGSGLSWRAGETHEVRAGDCLVYRPNAGAHTLIAGRRAARRARVRRAAPGRARAPAARGVLWAGPSWVADAVAAGHPWEREAAAGPLRCPRAVSPRPDWIVHRDDVEPEDVVRPGRRYRASPARRGRGRRHDRPPPSRDRARRERLSAPLPLRRGGALRDPRRDGHGARRRRGGPRARRARARAAGRERGSHTRSARGRRGSNASPTGSASTNDIVYYPDSRKFVRRIGVIGRIEPLGYWDGEDAPEVGHWGQTPSVHAQDVGGADRVTTPVQTQTAVMGGAVDARSPIRCARPRRRRIGAPPAGAADAPARWSSGPRAAGRVRRRAHRRCARHAGAARRRRGRVRLGRARRAVDRRPAVRARGLARRAPRRALAPGPAELVRRPGEVARDRRRPRAARR